MLFSRLQAPPHLFRLITVRGSADQRVGCVAFRPPLRACLALPTRRGSVIQELNRSRETSFSRTRCCFERNFREKSTFWMLRLRMAPDPKPGDLTDGVGFESFEVSPSSGLESDQFSDVASTHSPAPPHRRIELMAKLRNLSTGVWSECDGFFYPVRQLRSDGCVVLIRLLRFLVRSAKSIADSWNPRKTQLLDQCSPVLILIARDSK